MPETSAALRAGPPDVAGLKAALIAESNRQGFDVVGITSPDAIPKAAERLRQFLVAAHHGYMHWLATTAERRGHPRMLWPDVRSIIMLGLNYGPDHDPLDIIARRDRGAVSVYAKGDDYHEIIKPRLKALARWLTARAGGHSGSHPNGYPMAPLMLADRNPTQLEDLQR